MWAMWAGLRDCSLTAVRLQALPPWLVIVGDEEVVLEDSSRWAAALDDVSA